MMPWIIQRTENAHVSPPEEDRFWRTVARCRTERGLNRRLEQVRKDQRVGGLGTWSFNIRVVNDGT